MNVQTISTLRIIYNNTQKCVGHSRSIKNIRNSAIYWFLCNCEIIRTLYGLSDPRKSDQQCGTTREAGINFKSKELWRDN